MKTYEEVFGRRVREERILSVYALKCSRLVAHIVRNLNDSGLGSLRACAEATGHFWIVFDVSGTIAMQSTIHVASDKTIDGRGADITLTTSPSFDPNLGVWGNGIDPTLLQVGHYNDGLTGIVNNIIITNLKIQNVWANAMVAVHEWSTDVWIDHLTLQNTTDEQLFVGCGNPPGMGPCQSGTGANRAPTNVTISWVRSLRSQGTPRPIFPRPTVALGFGATKLS